MDNTKLSTEYTPLELVYLDIKSAMSDYCIKEPIVNNGLNYFDEVVEIESYLVNNQISRDTFRISAIMNIQYWQGNAEKFGVYLAIKLKNHFDVTLNDSIKFRYKRQLSESIVESEGEAKNGTNN